MEFLPKKPPVWSCWICGRAVHLEDCKVDEYGLPVHEECQALKLALRNPESSTNFRAPNVSIRRPTRRFGRKDIA
jgi:hypothetical protein